MKQIATFAFALTLMCVCSTSGLHAQFSGGGTGTAGDPFKIKTADDLNNVRNYIGSGNTNRHFRLMNDVDLTAFLQSYTDGWIPIGNNDNRFSGYFHGGGFQVNGLWINRPTIDYVGLFGTNSGTIDSVTVVISDKNIAGRYYVSGLIGQNYGQVNQCAVTGGSISGSNYCGGLIGRNENGTVSNCYSTSASFASNNSSGGLIGYNTGTVNNCYAIGASSTSGSYTGGLIGYNTGIVNNCYATGTSSSSGNYTHPTGGLIGALEGGKVSNCYALGEVKSNNSKGAFAGTCTNANYLSQCYYNSDINGLLAGVGNGTGNNNVLGINTAGMKLKATFGNWDFYNTWLIEDGVSYPYLYENPPKDKSVIKGEGIVCANSMQTYSIEKGKTNYVWTVSNGSILSGQSTNQIMVKWNDNNNDGKVSVSYAGAQPVSRYIQLIQSPQPTINENGYLYVGSTVFYYTEPGMSNYTWTVTGGTINFGQGTDEIAVFWTDTSGKITVSYTTQTGCSAQTEELSVSPVQLFGGGLGTTDNPYLIRNAEQLSKINFLPGSHYSLTNNIDLTEFITKSGQSIGWSSISLWETGSFNGNYHTISGLWIDHPEWDDMGLFSHNAGTIEKLYVKIGSKGITGEFSTGGLVGWNTGTISECGVIEGVVTTLEGGCGGLCGYNEGNIFRSFANCTVWGKMMVGGLVGGSTSISKVNQCYSLSTVVGNSYIGGLVGAIEQCSISQSYSAGIVSGGMYVGGFLGYNFGFEGEGPGVGVVTNCYFDKEVSKQYDGLGNPEDSQYANINAKSTSDMMKRATFLAWDFNNVWKIDERESYPYFKWQDIKPSSIKRPQVDNNSTGVYPNPTTGIVYVNCEINTPIQVYSLSGSVLMQLTSRSEREIIDLSEYPNGMYLVRTGSIVQKIVKK